MTVNHVVFYFLMMESHSILLLTKAWYKTSNSNKRFRYNDFELSY